MNADNWSTAVAALRNAKHLVVFSGAGMSAESGIPTFRDADGFWQRFPPEKYATWNGLSKTARTDPHSVADFILNVVDPIARAEPNAGHRAVAALERRAKTTVVTQNVDGLHQTAGSTDVYEVHGSLLEIIDALTAQVVQRLDRNQLTQIADGLRKYVGRQSSGASLLEELGKHFPLESFGRHRPNLVLFGDPMAEPAWTNACEVVEQCDLFISVGTSGEVYPAAMLPELAAEAGATVITVDPHPSGDCPLKGTAGTVLPQLLRDAFGESR